MKSMLSHVGGSYVQYRNINAGKEGGKDDFVKKLNNANDNSVGTCKVHVCSEVEDEEGIQNVSLHPLKELWLVNLGSNTGAETLLSIWSIS